MKIVFTILYSVYFYRIVTASVYRKRQLYIIIYDALILIYSYSPGLNQKPIILGKKQTRRFTRASGNGFITYFIRTLGFPLGADEYRKSEKKIAYIM